MRLAINDNHPKVIHVGERRPRHHRIPQRLKEPMPVIAVQPHARVDARRPTWTAPTPAKAATAHAAPHEQNPCPSTAASIHAARTTG